MIDQLKSYLSGAVRSLTVWFNSTLAGLLLLLPEVQASLPELAQYLPANVYKWVAFAAVLSNILLRFKTRYALTEK